MWGWVRVRHKCAWVSRAHFSWESTFLHNHLHPCLDFSVQKRLKKCSSLSTNNYHADTSSAGEDASGALSDASPFFDFVKKAKITSCPGLRAQELVVAGMVEFLLLWDHTGTQNCLSPLFCKLTVSVHAVRDPFVHFTGICHLDFRQVPLLCPIICGKKSRGKLYFWHLP